MTHRKLRIAWSVAWALVAVLLIVLWTQSYQGQQSRTFRTAKTTIYFGHWNGKLAVRVYRPPALYLGGWISREELTLLKEQASWDVGWRPWYELPTVRTPVGGRIVLPYFVPVLAIVGLSGVSWIPQFPSRFTLR